MTSSNRRFLFTITGAVFIFGIATWTYAERSRSTYTSSSDLNSDSIDDSSEVSSGVLSGSSKNSGDTTGSSTGDGVDDFGACNTDTQEYCSGFYGSDWASWAEEHGYTSASWKLGLVDCLGDHQDDISDACSASLDRRQVLNDTLNTVCASDRVQYCAGVRPSPGSEPQVDCLKEHYRELSSACTEALDAHEAAKPSSEE